MLMWGYHGPKEEICQRRGRDETKEGSEERESMIIGEVSSLGQLAASA